MQKTKPYEPKLGDRVYTTQIAGCEPGKDSTTYVREIDKKKALVNVVYGGYMDREWVEISSCTFIKHGTIDDLDKQHENPYIFT